MLIAACVVVGPSGCGDSPVAPDEALLDAGPDYLKPVPVLIVDYDLQDMRLSYSKRTGELTATVSFRNMGPIPCSGGYLDPMLVVQRKPASYPFWFGPSYVAFVCDEPGGSGGTFTVRGPVSSGTWDVRATLFDESSDLDVITERVTVR
jgi:hypothetical protein